MSRIRQLVPATERRCPRCDARLVQRPEEPPGAYLRRQTCGHGCLGRDHPGPAPQDFPGATDASSETVPAQCPRCAGPWRWTPVGVSCVLCGRARIVAAYLAHALTENMA